MRRLLALLLLLATPLAAQSLDGRYYWAGSDPARGCTPNAYSEGSITLDGGQVFFVESHCALTNRVAIRDMNGAFLYDAQCSGEGDTWTERMLVYPTSDGVAVLSRGAARVYTRCQ